METGKIRGVAAIVMGVCCVSASAATIPLGTSGWEATWDSSLDPYVDIQVNAVINDAIYLQKSAEFTQGPGLGGLFPAIPITFRQTEASTITQIVIQDEIITNSTGVDWTDFHFDLLDGTDASFDAGSVFWTYPLENQEFSPDGQTFSVDGFGLGPGGTDAVVAAGDTWFPGDGALNGDLIIDVVSQNQAPWTTFTLKETPTPEPTTLMLLGIGVLALFGRRRNR